MADLDFDDFEPDDDAAAAEGLPEDAAGAEVAEAEPAEAEAETDAKGKKKKKKKEKKPKAKKEKKEKPEKDPSEQTGINPYTVMLCLTMLALAIGTLFLWLELQQYPTLKPLPTSPM